MKTLVIIILLLTGSTAISQRIIPPTDSLIITGFIKNPTVFSLADLDMFPQTVIHDLVIYSHKGEVKDTLTGLKGIPLKDLLASLEFDYDKPKNLNEFYFVFTASDDYKVVFSWNEIYNTELGNNFYILTELNGRKLLDMEQRILFISTADLNTGRRYIKGLKEIDIKRLNNF